MNERRRSRRGLELVLAWGDFVLVVLCVAVALTLYLATWRPGDNLAGFGLVHGPIAVSYALVGALVLTRYPTNRVGWLFSIIAIPSAVTVICDQYARYSLVIRLAAVPGGRVAAWIGMWAWICSFATLPLLLLYFPDGRLPSRRWRVALFLPAIGYAIVAFIALSAPRSVFSQLGPPGLVANLPSLPPPLGGRFAVLWFSAYGWARVVAIAIVLVALAAVLLRFRRASGDEREQLKWIVYGGTLTMLGSLTPYMELLALTGTAVPIAAGIAIFRYHLYDIDQIISRTLVYGLLTALLGLVYVGGVFVVGPLLAPGEGESSLVVAASTLAVAALFQPARRRIQLSVDRRFNRRRQDAIRIVEAFSVRLRDEVDLDTLSGELLSAVQQTMEPTRASLLLRSPRS